MILLIPLLVGCTWELLNEPCDTGTINLEVDALWASQFDSWQEPAVGTDFVCGLQRTDDTFDMPAPPDALACIGPGRPGPSPLAVVLAESGFEALRAGGEMLCGLNLGENQFECWSQSDGSDSEDSTAALTSSELRIALATDDQPWILDRLAPGEGHLCAVARPEGNQSDQPASLSKTYCYGEVPLVNSFNDGNFEDITFTDVLTSATMACGRADEGPEPSIDCWGDVHPTILEIIDSTVSDANLGSCRSTFNVTDGVLCTTRSGNGNEGSSNNCDDLPPVECWGDPEHPVVSQLETVIDVLNARGMSPPRIELGANFGCATYDAVPIDGGDSLVCWGEPGGAWEAYPRGTGWSGLSIAPEGRFACALATSATTSDPANDTDAPDPLDEAGSPPHGTLTCWGDLPGGALFLE